MGMALLWGSCPHSAALITILVPSFKSVRKRRQRQKLPLVKPKYKHKKKKKYANATSVKPFRKPANRSNLGMSLRFGAVGWSGLKPARGCWNQLDTVTVELTVMKKGQGISLGGIVFLPVIGGMTVRDKCPVDFETLNMRVGKVHIGSPAHKAGVTSQHYLHKLRTFKENTRGRKCYGPTQIIGSRGEYRDTYTNKVQVYRLEARVHGMLTRAFLEHKTLEVTLVSYV